MNIEAGDWVMYKQAKRYLIGEVGGPWPHCKLVYNVGGYPVHHDDIIEARPPIKSKDGKGKHHG